MYAVAGYSTRLRYNNDVSSSINCAQDRHCASRTDTLVPQDTPSRRGVLVCKSYVLHIRRLPRRDCHLMPSQQRGSVVCTSQVEHRTAVNLLLGSKHGKPIGTAFSRQSRAGRRTARSAYAECRCCSKGPQLGIAVKRQACDVKTVSSARSSACRRSHVASMRDGKMIHSRIVDQAGRPKGETSNTVKCFARLSFEDFG